MKIIKLEEHGLQSALLGLSLSYNCPPEHDMMRVANKLANQDGGHNVFLEQINVWFDIDAPRYWWQQFDRYRVGTTRQSESTMHTITKRHLTQADFVMNIPFGLLDELNRLVDLKDWEQLKGILPEAFLQRRVVGVNYKSLRNIIWQRENHRLKEWSIFCDEVLEQIEYPQWVCHG